jgi:N-acetylglucosaminyl-diphospho-decaprenol L-rhamnosyltransferase
VQNLKEHRETLHVAIAIVGFRNCGDIVRCMAALERSTYQDFEVVICENGGPAAYESLTAALGTHLAYGQKITVLESQTNGGYASGVNMCLHAAGSADAWWVLNPDTEPMPQSLDRMVTRLKEGDSDAVGNTILLGDGAVQSHGGVWGSWAARANSIGHGESAAKPVSKADIEKRQNYLNGASLLVNRRFVNSVGLMREEYFLYCEEVEWCLRAARRGIKLGYASGASVLHHQGTTTGYNRNVASRSRSSVYLGHRNAMLLTRDCFPGRLPVAAASAFLLLLWRYGARRAWRQLGYAYSGWLSGLRGERGRPNWIS